MFYTLYVASWPKYNLHFTCLKSKQNRAYCKRSYLLTAPGGHGGYSPDSMGWDGQAMAHMGSHSKSTSLVLIGR